MKKLNWMEKSLFCFSIVVQYNKMIQCPVSSLIWVLSILLDKLQQVPYLGGEPEKPDVSSKSAE